MEPTAPILICDDEPMLGAALARVLKRFHVSVVTDVEADVVAVATRERPCLVLLDVIQTRDGLDLLRDLRANPQTRDIPVLVISAVDNALVRQRSLEAGALGFVVKPFPEDFPEALARLAALLCTPEGRAAAATLHAFTARAEA